MSGWVSGGCIASIRFAAPPLRSVPPGDATQPPDTRASMAENEFPAIPGPICENTALREVNPHILCSPFFGAFPQPQQVYPLDTMTFVECRAERVQNRPAPDPTAIVKPTRRQFTADYRWSGATPRLYLAPLRRRNGRQPSGGPWYPSGSTGPSEGAILCLVSVHPVQSSGISFSPRRHRATTARSNQSRLRSA